MKHNHPTEQIYSAARTRIQTYDQSIIERLPFIKVTAYLFHNEDKVIYGYLVAFKRVDTALGVQWQDDAISNITSP